MSSDGTKETLLANDKARVTELYLFFVPPLPHSAARNADCVSCAVDTFSPVPQIRHVQLAAVSASSVRHVAIWAPEDPIPGVTARPNGVAFERSRFVLNEVVVGGDGGMCAIQIDGLFGEQEMGRIQQRMHDAVAHQAPYSYSRYPCTLLPPTMVRCLLSDDLHEPVICSGLVARILGQSMFPVPSAESPSSVFSKLISKLAVSKGDQQLLQFLLPVEQWPGDLLRQHHQLAKRVCEHGQEMERRTDPDRMSTIVSLVMFRV